MEFGCKKISRNIASIVMHLLIALPQWVSNYIWEYGEERTFTKQGDKLAGI